MLSLSPQREKYLSTTYERPMDDMNCIISSGQVGSVYLGNFDAASNPDYLRKHNIGAVLSICMQKIPYQASQYLSHYQHIYLDDCESENISRYFDTAYQFIEKARSNTNVLVHCMAGISRSATLLAAYLMKKNNIGATDALSQLERKRWQVYPNSGFVRQLHELERKHKRRAIFGHQQPNFGIDEINKSKTQNDFQTPQRESHIRPTRFIAEDQIQSDYKTSRPLDINFEYKRRVSGESEPRKTLFRGHEKQLSFGTMKDYNQKKQSVLEIFNSPVKASSTLATLDQYQRDFDTKRSEFVKKQNTYLSSAVTSGITTSKLDKLLNSTFKKSYF